MKPNTPTSLPIVAAQPSRISGSKNDLSSTNETGDKFGDILEKKVFLSSNKSEADNSELKKVGTVSGPQKKQRLATSEDSIAEKEVHSGVSATHLMNLSPPTTTSLAPELKSVEEDHNANDLPTSAADNLLSMITGALTPGYFFKMEQEDSLTVNASGIGSDNVESNFTKSTKADLVVESIDFDQHIDSPKASIEISDELFPSQKSDSSAPTKLGNGPTEFAGGTSFNTTLQQSQAPYSIRIEQFAEVRPPSEHISSHISSNKWGNEVGQKIVWLANQDEGSATLTLNPPELGPLKVVVHIENGQAHASFTSDQPEVRQALLDSIPKLKEVMNDAGISLGQASVGQESRQHQEESGNRNRGNNGGNSIIDSETSDESSINTMRSRAANGLIDTFV